MTIWRVSHDFVSVQILKTNHYMKIRSKIRPCLIKKMFIQQHILKHSGEKLNIVCLYCDCFIRSWCDAYLYELCCKWGWMLNEQFFWPSYLIQMLNIFTLRCRFTGIIMNKYWLFIAFSWTWVCSVPCIEVHGNLHDRTFPTVFSDSLHQYLDLICVIITNEHSCASHRGAH